MKHAVKIFKSLVVVMIAVLFVQCEKDDISSKEENAIQMSGNDFAITSASMVGVSIGDNGHTGVILMSGSETQLQ